MAKDPSNDISYYLSLSGERRDALGALRHLKNLKIAFEGNQIWIKDLSFEQVNSVEVRSIPGKRIYYADSGKLFLKDSYLPDRVVPALLWTPIERGLPIKLPVFNHNYLGIKEKVSIKIITSDKERPAAAMIIPLSNLKDYINTAPAVRLINLSWAIIDQKTAFLLGKPLLPLQADVHWMNEDFIIPVGCDFDLYVLTETVNTLLNPDGLFWVGR
ncbi:MAG: hypothetical protein EOP45_21780 [Sphingobacteriaceae bacterium]|nr:MAG: hypothetical protein EOP45_21780 [Sphingobacteriaceae bacterium]